VTARGGPTRFRHCRLPVAGLPFSVGYGSIMHTAEPPPRPSTILAPMRDLALPVEKELVAEKAAALGRAGESLAAALAALAAAEVALAAAPQKNEGNDAERAALRQRRRELRDIAAERLWCLLVQREAIGLYQHEAMLREQRVPAEVRLLAGPRPRRKA
jgi:hypothetical protein